MSKDRIWVNIALMAAIADFNDIIITLQEQCIDLLASSMLMHSSQVTQEEIGK